MSYQINGKSITLANGCSVDFEHSIWKTLVIGNVIIILLEIPVKINYDLNVFAISTSGDFLWRIAETTLFGKSLNDNCPYAGMIINDKNELVLFNWCDTGLIVDYLTGEIIEKFVTK